MKAMSKINCFFLSFLFPGIASAQFQITPITGGAFGRTTAPIAGVGVGFFPNGTTTSARFQINNFYCANPIGPLQNFLFRTDGGQGNMNMWQMFTGPTVNTTTEKARLFIDPLSYSQGVTNWNSAQINARFNHFSLLSPRGDMIFFAKGADRNQAPLLAGLVMERMRISAGNYDDLTFNSPFYQDFARVSISATSNNIITDPLAMLHIGDPTFYALGGHRPWMNYGIFINKHDDNVFLGEKQDEFNLSPISNVPDYNDNQNAVLVWADNTTNLAPNNPTPDVFRIMFSGVFQTGAAAGTSNHMNALEAMRFVPVPIPGNITNASGVNVGIGDFSRNNALFPFGNPTRRLEILTDKTTANSNGNPQIRITNFQQDPANTGTTGKYTELHVTQTGNMGILAFDNTLSGTNTANQTFSQRFVGINTINPGNTVEINSQYSAFNTINNQPQAGGFGPATGWAGLRFTDLTSASVVQANPGVGVLSVNTNGDVILVPDQMGTGGGGGFVNAQNGLTLINPTTVELGGFLLHPTQVALGPHNFELFNNTNGNISVGTNPAVYPVTSGGGANGANIAIGHQNNFTNQHGFAFGDDNSVGFRDFSLGLDNDVVNAQECISIGQTVKQENTGGAGTVNTAVAIGFETHNYNSGSILIGQEVVLPPNGPGMISIGTHFATLARTQMEAYISANLGATYSQIDNAAQTFSGGLQPDYIPAINVWNNNMVGIGKLNPSAGTKLDVAGSITCIGFTNNSDTTLKTNIQPINSNFATQKVKGFKTISYEWINKLDTAMYNTQYGFSAQQVETILGDLVHTGRDGKKSISYNGILSLVTKALQEEIKRNEHQDSIINQLLSVVNSCCNENAKATGSSTIDVELNDLDVIVLNQNVPNPFAEQTTISYNIPKNTSAAQILFYDINGRQIKAVDITKKGKGQLNVFANDLSNGIYSYTLIVDGKIFETKKMIKQQ